MADFTHPEALGEDLTVLAERLSAIESRIALACTAAGRARESVTLIPVTKFHPPELVAGLYDLGVRQFAESRHPEARDKAAALEGLDGIDWHFVGQVQTKKARQIAQYADALHSIDRPALVDALATMERDAQMPVFVQVNMTDDPGRGGVPPADLDALVDQVLKTDTLSLRGLMCIAPMGEDPAPAFERLAALGGSVRETAPEAVGLSMGMSGDFEIAIGHGATHLRIGAAITGKRPDQP